MDLELKVNKYGQANSSHWWHCIIHKRFLAIHSSDVKRISKFLFNLFWEAGWDKTWWWLGLASENIVEMIGLCLESPITLYIAEWRANIIVHLVNTCHRYSKQWEWGCWAHKPGLTHLSLVHSSGPSVVLCARFPRVV